MAYDFFFSYTRANNDAYLKMLFQDLSEDIRLKRGLSQGADVGFFDQRELELGENWDASIVDALQFSKVMLAVASPGYFKSEYCGKEWALFRQRCKAAAGATGQKVAPLLKSIIWVPFVIGNLPADVTQGQLTMADPQAIHNLKGMRYMLKQIQEHRTAYNDLIDKLGSEIIAAADQYDVPPLVDVPTLASVKAAFASTVLAPAVAGAGPPAAAALPAPSGPKHVYFVYVAADPNAFGTARPPAPYAEHGGGEWMPFYPPDTTRVHRLLQKIASGDDLDFTSTELPFGADLIDHIDKAWDQRQLVVIVIDGWSVHWDSQRPNPAYQALLRKLDGRLDYHWCVLVPWNDSDTVASAQRDAITATVRNTFDRHATLAPNPMFFRDGIRSSDELKTAVADVLTRLKEEIKKRAPVQRLIPLGPARLVVSGPSV